MRKILVGMSLGSVVACLGIAAAVATPTRGLTYAEVSRGMLTSGGTVDLQPGTETGVVRVTIEPRGSTGQHSHTDPGVLIVDKGVLSSYGLDGPPCDPVEAPAGQAYFVPPNARYRT